MSNSGCDGMCYVIDGEWGEVQGRFLGWFKNIPMRLRIASMTTATAGVEHP
jgi:hypothetical protein